MGIWQGKGRHPDGPSVGASGGAEAHIFMGAAFALVFSNLGAAYGTGKSGMGISALGVGKPERTSLARA